MVMCVRSANRTGPSDTKEQRLADILNECLEAMERGEQDLDRLTDRYPDAQNEIRPLLETGQMLLRCDTFSEPWELLACPNRLRASACSTARQLFPDERISVPFDADLRLVHVTRQHDCIVRKRH